MTRAEDYQPEYERTTKNDLPKYCDRNICLKNEYNNIGCEDCEVTKSQEPTTKNDLGVDCISRQAVLDLMIQKWGENFSGDSAMQESIDAIRVLPSVTPQEPKTGHWISKPHIYGVAFCSECDFELRVNDTNYCPNCGAKMIEPQADKEQTDDLQMDSPRRNA